MTIWMHKNHKLILILLLLIVTSLALSFSGGKTSSTRFRIDTFSLADTSAIQSITIMNDELVKLEKSAAGNWVVNDQFDVDPSLKRVLLAVLNQVSVKRPVAQIQNEEITASLKNGTRVQIALEDRNLAFYAGGSPERTQSYFLEEGSDQPYVVEIPGYRNYISGIFELKELQWKDRKIFNTHWRSLQSLQVDYPGNSEISFRIFFNREFFEIEGISAIDTTALMTYLAPFEYFETNEFIQSGFSSRYDSLLKTEPIAIITIEDINKSRSQQLTLFSKPDDDNFVLGLNKDGEMSLFDFRRIRQLLAKRDDFSR